MEGNKQFTRRELYDLVWKTPVDQLAKQFGISGRGLGKICERSGIPVPPRGYWAKAGAGKRVTRPPLIEIEGRQSAELAISILPTPAPVQAPSDGSQPETAKDPFKELWDRLSVEAKPIKNVAATLSNPHQVVASWIADEKRDYENSLRWGGRSSSFRRYAAPLEKRRLRIISALLKELEALGFKVEQDRRVLTDFWVSLKWDQLRFDVSERIRQVRRELTAEEKANWGGGQKWTQTREPTGELVLGIRSVGPTGVPGSWKDEPDAPLEQKLHLAVAAMQVFTAYTAHQRELAAIEERKRWEARKEALRLQELEKALQARKKALREAAQSWREAADIRAYVAAVREAVGLGKATPSEVELEEWSAWALAHAAELDPIDAGRPLAGHLSVSAEDEDEDDDDEF
jgi:hypothetical protein